jgi:cellulose 1,4-beta-cellobiosidase
MDPCSFDHHICSYVSPYYAAEVAAEIASLNAAGQTELAAKAAEVAKVPTFIWISDTKAVDTISSYLQDALVIQKNTGKKQSELCRRRW